tara:strand:+ start:640 stop:1965 length:1326 start_codon:yes stop_codon:yes gene_type:complete
MHNKILSNIKSIISKEKPHFLLAISGGVDSMVLLDLFQKNNKILNFSVAHINHNYHSESKVMEDIVKVECKKNQCRLIIKSLESTKITSNIESRLRKLRYNKLEEIRTEISADYIVTAHHADDQVETILMKILNSSGLDGMQGIRKINQKIIRPCRDISKKEIIDYANQNRLSYVNDPTNLDTIFTRNFLRKKIIPELKKIKNDIHVPFIDFTKRVEDVQELILFNVQSFCNTSNYKINNEIIEINKVEFFKLPFLVQLRIFSNAFLKSNNSFSKTNIRELKDFLRKNQTGSVKQLNSKTILIDNDSLFIYKNLKNEIFSEVEAGKKLKSMDFTFSWDFKNVPNNFDDNNQVEYIDASKLKNNLIIRSVRDNDIFLPLGMSGKKKVVKFLKDKKLSMIKRKESLVVCNDNDIVWVAGHQLSEKYKIHKDTTKTAKLNFFRN